VLAACLQGFGPAPDLVVSGINPGANVGRFLQLHSGTLGAVLTAAGLGLSGMAVSIRPLVPSHWESAAEVAARLVDYVDGCERRTTLNVNVPDVAFSELRGVRSAQLGAGGPRRLALGGSAPGRLRFTWVEREARPAAPEHDSALLDAGYVSLTRVLPPATAEPEPFPVDLRDGAIRERPEVA
jgi:5'-nucleotidase